MGSVVFSAGRLPRKKRAARGRHIISALLILQALVAVGCGSGVSNATAPSAAAPSTPAVTGPQTYFESAVEGPVAGTGGITQQLATFSIDDTKQTFAQTTYGFGQLQSGPQLNYSGSFSKLPRGLLSLSTDFYYATYGLNSCGQADCDTYPSPAIGGYAVELAGQAGGLVQLDKLPFTPLAAATACPASSKPLAYQFVTIPAAVSDPTTDGSPFTWDPMFDTAYGTVGVSTAGGSVVFSNIAQFTAAGKQIINYSTLAGAPVAYTSISGTCSPTFYGNTISVPGTVTITSTPTTETFGVSATVGIGPTNLLVESNGNLQAIVGASVPSGYQPFLGAGSGAMGLPKPTSPIVLSDLAGAQYLGFIYNSGTASSGATGWTSTLGSFGGFPASLPASCAAETDATGTQSNPIFGGDFPNNDATMTGDASVATFGNCDVSIYLNAQDPNNNGLFPNASVTLGPNFSGNGTGNFSTSTGAVTFPAVAIAGQLGGKFAIFLVSSTGEGIYLFQSN
jgi:hypothetical protein